MKVKKANPELDQRHWRGERLGDGLAIEGYDLARRLENLVAPRDPEGDCSAYVDIG